MPAHYTDSDADPAVLDGQRIAILGYGPLGRAFALNLYDSGLNPVIGVAHPDEEGRAAADGFEPLSIAEAAQLSPFKVLTLPDEQLAERYFAQVASGLQVDDTLVFTSGYCMAFGFIEPPPFVDAIMIAPRTDGDGLRAAYTGAEAPLSFIAVEQDSSGRAWPHLLALARMGGALRGGALELPARQEAELRLFVQGAVLPALTHVLTNAAELLIREGYPPEAAFISLYTSGELGKLLSTAAASGILAGVRALPTTGQYLFLARSDRFQDTKLARILETSLEEVRGGKVAQEWAAEHANGSPRLAALWGRRAAQTLWRHEEAALALLRLMRGE
jgi:ketol-acid reductoisomerase